MDIIEFTLNNKKIKLAIKPGELLIDTLRNRLNIKSVKHGCGIGECGTCTVLINNEPVYSCITLTEAIKQQNITTLEGINSENIENAFIETGAVQCGFCTPGMMLVAYSIAIKGEKLDKNEIKERISGNLCRCTGYNQIIEAVENVLKN